MNDVKKNETTIGWSAAERERRLPIIQKMIFSELDENLVNNGDRLPKHAVTRILKKHKKEHIWLNRRIIHHFFRKLKSSKNQIVGTTNDDSNKKTKPMETSNEKIHDNWNLPLNQSDPVLKIKIPSFNSSDEQPPPLNRSTMCLETLLYPLSKEQFFYHCFRKKAVHIDSSSNIGRDGRMKDLIKGMCCLDIRKIIEETSSDNIFVWLVDRTSQKSSLSSKKDGTQKKLVQSIQMEDPNSAFQLHTIGNHALYFRAPPDVEQPLVSQMLASTGLGCGQYDPSGCQTTTMGHGEVETFVGTKGHFTNWHTDFQENFTIQLSGSKKWKLKQCTVKHPVRGCTPHYGKVAGVVENQLKLARLSDKTFSFDHPNDSNSYGNIEEVIMNTGDILYFPAGMWHSVETLTPGISINISLMSTNYADIVTKALHHYLLTQDEWRESITTLSSSCQSNNDNNHNGLVPVMEKLQSLFQTLPQITKQLVQNNFQECIIPPVLRHPPKFQHVNDDDDDDDNGGISGSDKSDSESMDETNQYHSDNDKDDLSAEESSDFIDETNNDDSFLDHDEYNNDSEDEEGLVRIETGSFQSPNEWAEEEKMISQHLENGTALLMNPLASLIPMKDIVSYYDSTTAMSQQQQQHRDGGILNDKYMLNVNFGGHDNFQSSVRVILVDTSPNKILAQISCHKKIMNEKEVQPKNMFDTSNDESISTLHCLLYYGLYTFGIKTNKHERVA